MQTLILKGAKPGNLVKIARSKEVEEFLLRKGVKAESEDSEGITFCVDNPYSVYAEIEKNGFIN